MKMILPGAVIGLLGGGQLGRMFAMAALKMGYRIHVYDPASGCPAGMLAEREVNRPFDDLAALSDFAEKVEVVTYEFENIPSAALESLGSTTPLHPAPSVLHICQNRRREKEFLQRHGFPVVPFLVVTGEQDLAYAVNTFGVPAILKTADFGYDGKGQQKISAVGDVAAAWKAHGAPVGVVEKWIDFQAELSVIVARNSRGETVTFPIGRNVHENHILALTSVPSGFPHRVEKRAREIASGIADCLGLVGLLAVECFLTRDNEVIVNELAPRPHNSGHYSFDASITSQFEQHVRAVCGLPLGDPEVMMPVIMRNLLGDLWNRREPPWDQILALPGLKLHLYGKREARPGRKMGHYCVLASTVEEALKVDARAQKILLASA